jgi:hypothetical protein
VSLRETSTRKFDGRVFYVGLSYRIGGAGGKAQEQGNGPRFRGRGGDGPPGGGPGGPGGLPGGGGPEG